MRFTGAFLVGILPAILCSNCHASPAAPTSTPSTPGGALAGEWSGTGSDSQGAEEMTWVLTQRGDTVSGSVSTQSTNPTDGSCASCHKNKSGTLSGTIADSVLRLTMYFPTGGDVPTPICSVTMVASAEGFTVDRIAAPYSGGDTCEGPFTDGAFEMLHQR